jgi:peptidoglycan/LPS O-acetylase OafA/YrhL
VTSAVASAPPATASTAPASAGRFPCIDGLRAIAALAVVVYHVTGNWNLRTLRFDTWAWTARLGNFGVAVFFLISGLLLYRPFVTAAFAGRPRPAAVPYFERRFLRIFPAYWLALTALIVLGFFSISGTSSFVTAFGLLQNYRAGYPLYGLGVEWTLVIEVSFYVALPVIAAGLRRLTAPDAPVEQKLRAQLVGLAGLYLLAVAVRIWDLWVYDPPVVSRGSWFPLSQINYWLVGYLDWFALGMLLAVGSAWVARGGRLPWIVDLLTRYPAVCWFIAIELFWVAMQLNAPASVFIGRQTRVQAFMIPAVFGLVALFLLLPAVFGPQDEGVVRRFLRSRVMVKLGLISYGIYLWHLIWLRQVKEWTNEGSIGASIWTWFAVTLALTLVSATVSWLVLERPLLSLAQRWTRRPRPAPATTGSTAPRG